MTYELRFLPEVEEDIMAGYKKIKKNCFDKYIGGVRSPFFRRTLKSEELTL